MIVAREGQSQKLGDQLERNHLIVKARHDDDLACDGNYEDRHKWRELRTFRELETIVFE